MLFYAGQLPLFKGQFQLIPVGCTDESGCKASRDGLLKLGTVEIQGAIRTLPESFRNYVSGRAAIVHRSRPVLPFEKFRNSLIQPMLFQRQIKARLGLASGECNEQRDDYELRWF